jgi:nicotinamidase-related amidase
MAGAPSDPARLAEAALVIIDAQGEYREGRLPLDGIGAAVDALADLLRRARAAGTPVIHIAHRGRAVDETHICVMKPVRMRLGRPAALRRC